MANTIIKATAKERGVLLWEIADRLGISDGAFSRKLRKEFSANETEKILSLVSEIASEKGGVANGKTESNR